MEMEYSNYLFLTFSLPMLGSLNNNGIVMSVLPDNMTDLSLITNSTDGFSSTSGHFAGGEGANAILTLLGASDSNFVRSSSYSGTVEDVEYIKVYNESWQTNIHVEENENVLMNVTSKKKFINETFVT